MECKFASRPPALAAFIAATVLIGALCGYACLAAEVGLQGSFTLTFSRTPPGSSEPSYQVNMDGTFICAPSKFSAETSYPIPGGGSEKIRLLVLEQGTKLVVLYPETLNYRRIPLGEDSQELLKVISTSIGDYFNATPERLVKAGLSLESLGALNVRGESLLAYKVRLPNMKEPMVIGNTGQEWRLMLYFSPKGRKIRAVRVYSEESDLKLLFSNVRKKQPAASEFAIPNGYYELAQQPGKATR